MPPFPRLPATCTAFWRYKIGKNRTKFAANAV
jgi:hypothetical protein